MTKTITQWFDGLSPRAQEVIKREAEDCTFHFTVPNTELNVDANAMLQKIFTEGILPSCFSGRYGRSADWNETISFLTALKLKQDKVINEDEYLKFIDERVYGHGYDIRYNGLNIMASLTLDERRKLLKIHDGEYASRTRSFVQKIINTDDFENFNDLLEPIDVEFFQYHTDIKSQFISEELLFEYYKLNPTKYTYSIYEEDKQVFDCLFFGKNGWTHEDKKRIVSNLFGRRDIDKVVEYFKRVITVDPYWLHYLNDVLDIRGTAAAMHDLKKSDYPIDEDTDADGNIIQGPDDYRLSKDLRKLCIIAHCCNRKSLPKTKNSSIGDAASLVRLYDFRFSDIVDCLYPDNMEPKTFGNKEVITE